MYTNIQKWSIIQEIVKIKVNGTTVLETSSSSETKSVCKLLSYDIMYGIMYF